MPLILDIISDQHLTADQKTKAIQQILKTNPDESTKVDRAYKNHTLLNYAVLFLEAKTIKILIDAGIPLDTTGGKHGKTALHFAALRGEPKIVEILLATQAVTAIETADLLGKTPLNLASEYCHEEVIKRLLAAGASLSQTSNGRYPLHHAVTSVGSSKHRDTCVTFLINAGASIYQKDHKGETPLDLASRKPDLHKHLKQSHERKHAHDFYSLGRNHASIVYHARVLYLLRNTPLLAVMPNELLARIILFTGQKPPILPPGIYYINPLIFGWHVKNYSPTSSDKDIHVALNVFENIESQRLASVIPPFLNDTRSRVLCLCY